MITLEANAKINLFLEILGKRRDGFHEMVTVMQTVSLADRLTAQRTDSGVRVSTNDPALPTDRDNLAGRGAALVLQSLGNPGGVSIEIAKRIPVGAGLGGGSSDAACAMRATNALYGSPLSIEALAKLGAQIGSDVPFFFRGGAALCTGRGEVISDSAHGPTWEATLFCPDLFVSTAQVYGNLATGHAPRDGHAFWASYLSGDFQEQMFNRLAPAACGLHPELGLLCDAGLTMSGSGSAFYSFTRTAFDGLTTHAIRSIGR